MPLILPGNVGSTTAATGYDVANSLRLNVANTAYLSVNMGTSSNRRIWTFSIWHKKSTFGGTQNIVGTGGSSDQNHIVYENSQLTVRHYNGSANDIRVGTNRQFEDVSAFYHIVVAVDTTQGTAANRVKIYVNGVQETSFEEATYPDQNYDWDFFQNGADTYISRRGHNDESHLDGYIAEVAWLDGTQAAPTAFGEFDSDSGIWKPKDFKSDVTFGDAGFYLEFKESGTSQNSSGLGADTSGQTNHFAVTNLAADHQTTDTCTNNFMTLNPLIGTSVGSTDYLDNQVYSEGNTIVIPNSTDNYGTASGTFGANKGKWYWEAQIIWNGTSNNANFPKQIGFMREDYEYNKSYLGQNDDQTWGVGFADLSTDGWGLDHNGSFSAISGATTLADDKMVMFALDLDNGKFYMGYDGTFFTSGDPTSGATGTGAIATLDSTDLSFIIIPALTNATNTTHYKMNFGNPAYAIASSNADGNGYGNFEFAVPSGYFSWCTKNLAEYG